MSRARRALELLPAIDVAGGRAVRLPQGVHAERSDDDPRATALRWQAAGASWVHLVDIDQAFGRGHNRELLDDLVGSLDVDVELAGGIRDDETLDAALTTGCRRVVIAASALADPDWCIGVLRRYGERVALGLDVRGRTLAPRGRADDGDHLYAVMELLETAGCTRYVVTDVTRDGTREGPNLALMRDVCRRTASPVVASGGVSTLDDLRALASLVPAGVEGVIVGAALHSGVFTVEAALEVTVEAASSLAGPGPGLVVE